jgi:uncharacterized coiled-coil protein SlyX
MSDTPDTQPQYSRFELEVHGRLSTLETGQVSLNQKLDSLDNHVTELERRIEAHMSSKFDELLDRIDDRFTTRKEFNELKVRTGIISGLLSTGAAFFVSLFR